MSERKVLNKYYPPDFDPSKIPRVRQAKNRQFTVRLMAPFNMKCKTCGEYIYKGKKFNARKEDVDNENYLGIRIYRFYIKCTRCLSEISFKTDPVSTDYVIEAGATRNFMALKLAEEQAQREVDAEKEEERTNPMKLLENRTKASRGEIETVEALEELKELNKRKVAINYDGMLDRYDQLRQTDLVNQEMQDELEIRAIFGERTGDGKIIKRIADASDSSEDDASAAVFWNQKRSGCNQMWSDDSQLVGTDAIKVSAGSDSKQTLSAVTRSPPAPQPKSVTTLESPLKCSMFLCTQVNAAVTSVRPRFDSTVKSALSLITSDSEEENQRDTDNENDGYWRE
uniref:Splicing factor YJU2 n=1 Tax=Evadne anonyx TaxID=141404 RepID=A0A9N6ZFK9_9CRUS|nr:EOG090X0G3U [Evadne anonyx]